MYKLDLEKAEEPEIKLPTSTGSPIKQENSRKTFTSASLSMLKPFNCVDHNKLWEILKEMGIPDHLTCLLRNLYAGQEATVRTRHGTTDWFQIGKGVLPDVQAGFRKGRGTRDQIANICWIMEKATEFQENIYFCFMDYAKAFDCVDHNKLWEILKEMGLPDHLTCLLRNLYAGQEATLRTGHGTTDWFK